MCGDRPHPVPRRVVEALIEATDARGILQLGSKLRSGGAVRLMAGPQGASRSFFIFSAGRSQLQLMLTSFSRCSKSNCSRAAADAAAG